MSNKRLRGYLTALTAVVALAGLTVAASVLAKPVNVVVGNSEVEYGGGFSPRALPKDELTPISFFLWAKIRDVEGGHPPAIKGFELKGDKNVEVDVEGLPACASGELESQTTAAARKACGPETIVGSGRIEVQVQFPERPPIDVKGELLAFNGGFEGGVTTLYVHTHLTAPVNGAIVTTMKIKSVNKGRYGTEAIASIPKIAGGAGSVTYFKLKLGEGMLSAKCPDGRLRTHATAVFADSTEAAATVVGPCSAKS